MHRTVWDVLSAPYTASPRRVCRWWDAILRSEAMKLSDFSCLCCVVFHARISVSGFLEIRTKASLEAARYTYQQIPLSHFAHTHLTHPSLYPAMATAAAALHPPIYLSSPMSMYPGSLLSSLSTTPPPHSPTSPPRPRSSTAAWGNEALSVVDLLNFRDLDRGFNKTGLAVQFRPVGNNLTIALQQMVSIPALGSPP